jgi:hypothetical protein
MNSLNRSKLVQYTALSVLLLLLGCMASAQDIRGKFDLPFTARWGGVVLAPGQYSLTYAPLHPGDRPVITLLHALRFVGVMSAIGTDEGKQYSDASRLTAIRIGATYRITSLQLSAEGEKVYFPTPKRELLEGARSGARRNVPILEASK